MGDESATPDSPPSSGIQSVDRAISTMQILAREGSAGVSEVAGGLDVHKSTAFRLLSSLEQRGLVEQNTDRSYQLGLGILRLALAVPRRLDVVQEGSAECDALALDFGESANLAVMTGDRTINVYEARGPSAVSAQNEIGEASLLHTTSSGKVFLAYMSAEDRRAALGSRPLQQLAPATVTDRRELESHMQTIAGRGYSLTTEEYEVGMNAIGAPIRDGSGRVMAAISVSGPAYRLTEQRMRDNARQVIGAATRVSARMGYLR